MTNANKNNLAIEDIDWTDEIWDEVAVDVDKALAEKDVDTLIDYVDGQVRHLKKEDGKAVDVKDWEQHSFNQFIQCLIIKDVLERCEEAEVGLPSKFQRNCWAAMMESHSNNAKSAQTFIREGISVPLEEDGLTLEELYNMYTYHANDCTKQILLII